MADIRKQITNLQDRIEGDSDEGGVTSVSGLVDHREDVSFPTEHISGIGNRIVAVRQPRGDPFDALRKVVAVRYPASEDSESRPVVVVRVFVLVIAVDPPNKIFCRVTVFESVREATDVLSQNSTMAEQLVVAVIGVFRFEQVNPVGKFYENFLISLFNFLFSFCKFLILSFILSVSVSINSEI